MSFDFGKEIFINDRINCITFRIQKKNQNKTKSKYGFYRIDSVYITEYDRYSQNHRITE